MKLHQKILIKSLVGIAVFPAIAFGSSFVSSLIQGKTPGEAVQILAGQINSLVERVNVLEIMQSEGDIRTEVLESGFQNIDEFRRKYESAKEICEASDEELKEKVFEMVKWGDSCRSEDGYNELVFTRPQEFRQRYPDKIQDRGGKIYYCPECINYTPTRLGYYEEGLRCVFPEGITSAGNFVYYYNEHYNQTIQYEGGCIEEATYNEIVFSTPQEWQQKYSENIEDYYCSPQELNEKILEYRKNELSGPGFDTLYGPGGCNLAEKYKELYQKVMKSGL